MNSPLVSVIIPNYNHERYLKQRIDSVLNQSYENFEVIILDDCSTDNSKDVINQYLQHPKVVKVEFNEQNSGSTFRQWEKGISYASGEFIWIAESDDVADLQFLEIIEPHFDDPESVLVFTDCKIINENSEVLHEKNSWIHDPTLDIGYDRKVWQGKDFLNEYQRYRNFVSNASSAVFRKSVLTKALLEEIQEYRYSGDWLFWNKIALKGKVAFTPKALCFWRSHDKSTRSISNLEKDVLRLREATRVIKSTNSIILTKAKNIHYNWMLNWWMSRYSYRNLLRFKYFFVPLPSFLKFTFYKKLFLRTILEMRNSIKKKLHRDS